MRVVGTAAVLSLAALIFTATLARGQEKDQARGLKIRVGATSKDVGRADIGLSAILIGVSRYQFGDQDLDGNRISNLKHASDDAEAMRDFLRSPEGGGFRDDRIVFLSDEQATKANVLQALTRLKQTKPDDFFVIYIAAHGAVLPVLDTRTNTTRDIPYFLLYDTDIRDPERTAVRMEVFRQAVDGAGAKKGLVLSDTCYSGGVQLIGRAGVDESTVANQRYLDEMSRIPAGVGFISAARQTERSYEKDDFSHGVFTYALLEALGGNADGNQDGKVTFDEVVGYLDTRVPAMTNNRQHPFANTTAVEANNLALSVVTYANLAASGPRSFGLLRIQVPDLDGVNVAIDSQPPSTLDKGVPRTFRVESGNRRLLFSRGNTKREWTAKVEPGKLQPFTINFAFSESETAEDSLIEPGEGVNVYLPPDKEPSRDAVEIFKRGVDLFNKQDFKKAIDEFNKAIAREGGGYAEALVYRGRAEQSLGLDKDAVVTFQKAFQLRPTDYETQTLLAEARFNAIANLDQVEKDLRDVINRHPDFAFARVVLADLLHYLGKPRLAEWELRQAINDDPNYPAAYLELADALTYQPSAEKQKEAMAMAEKALALFKQVSEKKVKFSTGLKRLSISHVIFGHANYSDDRVMAEANHMVAKTKTRYVEYSYKNLSSADRAQMLDSARVYLNESLKLSQRLADKRRLALALETSSQNYFLKGDMKNAIDEGTKALKVAAQFSEMKDFPDVHLTLSGAYESAQDYAKAAEHLQKYVEVETLSDDARNRKKEKISFLLKRARANGQIK